MDVLVLGAGLIGTTSAHFLARAGHDVTVIDRQPGPGLETSFANGGQISACHTQPWAHPETPVMALRWLGRADAPLVFGWARWDPALWVWGLRFLANCTLSAYDRNMERAVRVALYSRSVLKELRAETGLRYDERTRGILKIYRDQGDFDKGLRAMEKTAAWGLRQSACPAARCLELEPALATGGVRLAGGILAAEDESGDAHLFTQGLAALSAAKGVRFLGETTITGLRLEGRRVAEVLTSRGPLRADTIVLAAGSFSPGLARTIGLRLPVYPAKGYSITLDVKGAGQGAPTLSITDEASKMVYSRLGQRLRAAGTAELAGWSLTPNPARAALIRREAARLFPQAGDYAGARDWCGLRPTTPDSVPIIGKAPGIDNLYLNTGHGTLGWTMACGSGKLIADLVSGRATDIDTTGLGLDRF
ncbi:amino acid dehydrogenase [Rhodospirillum rubrum]|uniref:D-amino acid dehydrogenase n=1 Tax=Rhodospirillum rubrum TaxID=1085 RepID=UPI0019036E47|nr:D-amino acid dehydrogenase [Rhodospirillum rubrum]MBK1663333.1 amino acid dehydrogenase [Rhodospirillum rubrum]MBK1675144.1 amino acid dehydrogenase [Rhodospirillum rubrum]